ncbi:uncharacterized protein C8Q71DRAFT_196289 [Rhodofomes roseus]|uniref:F-box domain-containing protein n=1 Tax=Rhodofomes roseus TaxID=34475 RepID=A0ABQ8K7V6_9APHY|nr:uncharacterized protein C8Q71DRAFT_196289 [Rhodofomes roseus]KAH9833273.1 hypothetical protein C8Q71DRAFT_196289 [Rhodofomes roseus]
MLVKATPTGGLPVEVWDNIIGWLRNDMGPLMACSLTCRAIFPPSRRHAFCRVGLNSAADFNSLEAFLNKPNYVQHCIRSLTIRGSGRKDSKDRTFPANGQWLLRLLPKLGRLSHIRMFLFSFSIPEDLRHDVGALAPSLRTLDFMTVGSKGSDLGLFIFALDDLSTLIDIFNGTPKPLIDTSCLSFPPNLVPRHTVSTLLRQPIIPVFASQEQALSLGVLAQAWDKGAQCRLRRIAMDQVYSEATPSESIQQVLVDSKDTLEELFLECVFSRPGNDELALDLSVSTA